MVEEHVPTSVEGLMATPFQKLLTIYLPDLTQDQAGAAIALFQPSTTNGTTSLTLPH